MKESKSEHVYAKWEIAIIIPHVLDAIGETLASGEEVQLQGFGRFDIKTVKAHNAVNPCTKERVWVQEKKKIVFHQISHFKFNEMENAETESETTEDKE